MVKRVPYAAAGVAALLLLPAAGTWFYLNNSRGTYVFLLAFSLVVAFTPAVIWFAYKMKILDLPDSRKIHANPIPRIGGLAIFLAFMITVFRNFRFPPEVIGLLSGALIIFIAGFADDIKSNSAFLRLGAQLAAVAALIYSGVYIKFVPIFKYSLLLDYLLTAFWVVGIVNAINFLDGIDGLAAGLGAISGLCFFIIVFLSGQKELAYLLMAFIGACCGFLVFNFRPAKIFMGDSGSSVIGFLLAGFSIIGVWNSHNRVIGAAMPILILGIPIFDMIYTTISRVINGSVKSVKEWLEFTGKDHFHHRLLNIGFSQRSGVIFLYALNLILGLSSVALLNTTEAVAYLLLVQAVFIFLIIVTLMRTGRKLE